MSNNNATLPKSNLSMAEVVADVHPIPSTAPQLPIHGQQQLMHNPLEHSVLLRNIILNEVLLRLPALFDDFLNQNDRSYIGAQGSGHHEDDVDVEALQKDVVEMKKQNKDWDNKIKGYEKKLEVWTGTVTSIDGELTEVQNKIVNFSKDIKQTKKTIIKKTEEIDTIRNKIKETMEETNKTRVLLKKSIDELETVDGKKIIEIEGSQEFVSSQYDKLVESTTELKNNYVNLEKQVQINSQKSEKNASYTRWDCLEVGGVPLNPDFEGKEDCKKMVMDICKALHLSLRDDAISTAHRLKQHPSKTGPPPIIVKFCRRDDRNDVFSLRKQLRTTKVNILGIDHLFINESLTPEKKKTLYQCKMYARENYERFGKIYIWSFKGNVYARQDVENAKRIKIDHKDDLIPFGETCVNVGAYQNVNAHVAVS